MIAMPGGFAYAVLFCAGFMLLPGRKLGFAGYMGSIIGVNIIFCAASYLWLKKRGCALFAEL